MPTRIRRELRKRVFEPDEMTLVTAGHLAWLFNLTTERLGQLADAGHMERERHGKYRLVSSLWGYLRYLKGTRKPPSPRQRYIAAKADLLEFKVCQMKASLVPVEIVEAEWQEFCRVVRSRILGVPNASAPFLVGQSDTKVIEAVLGNIVQEIVRELDVPEPSRWTTPST